MNSFNSDQNFSRHIFHLKIYSLITYVRQILEGFSWYNFYKKKFFWPINFTEKFNNIVSFLWNSTTEVKLFNI